MTDEQVIQALKRCGCHTECCYCNSVEECGSKRALAENCLDLINRKDAEIERLKEVTTNTINSSIEFGLDKGKEIQKAKSEAYKEFAERLKEKAMQKFDWNEYIEVEDIDNLLKELTEGGNEDGMD